jgi:hypothetical protein
LKQGDKKSYLSYIFAKISELFISLQGRGVTVVRIVDEAQSLKENKKLQKRRVREKNIAYFLTPNLSQEDEHFTFTSVKFVLLISSIASVQEWIVEIQNEETLRNNFRKQSH